MMKVGVMIMGLMMVFCVLHLQGAHAASDYGTATKGTTSACATLFDIW
ncbi:hypothetical protein KJ885_03655 [Patescibacteria group bacterium]|nr:hypothetical protein [Patescibacteria group bacterium]